METDDDDEEVVEDTKDGVNDEVSCDVLDKSSTYAAVVEVRFSNHEQLNIED
jgi:hypothetical protein